MMVYGHLRDQIFRFDFYACMESAWTTVVRWLADPYEMQGPCIS